MVSIKGGVHFDLVKRVLRDIQRSGQAPEEIIQQVCPRPWCWQCQGRGLHHLWNWLMQVLYCDAACSSTGASASILERSALSASGDAAWASTAQHMCAAWTPRCKAAF